MAIAASAANRRAWGDGLHHVLDAVTGEPVRGVVATWDSRLAYLTVITSTQMQNSVQHGLAECLDIPDGAVRIISPDVGGGFGYKGLLLREEVALAWLARRTCQPVRWLEDCREHLSANANCREHHYRITGYADGDGRLLAVDCEASVDAGAYSVYPTSAALEAAQVTSLLPGPYDFSVYRCRSAAVAWASRKKRDFARRMGSETGS